MKILIIDDCAVSRNILTKQLDIFGECHTAINGLEAVSMFEKALEKGDPYKLLCLDISMPEMDGCEVLDTVRSIEKEFHIPEENAVKVLIITAFADDDNFMKTYKNCQGYLLKPIRQAKLIEKITSLGFVPPLSDKTLPAKDLSETVSGFDYADMIPMIRNNNGNIEFFIKDKNSADKTQQKVDPEKLEFFRNVIAGQMLVKSPVPDSLIKCGDGVFFNSLKMFYSAQKSGKVIYKDGVLSIQDTLIINGNVKFDSIYFLGKIEIHGDVQDGIKINGAKGIKIFGSAGACDLRSESDISVERMNGKGKGTIKCGGRLHARFIHNTIVECRNDITVEVEAVDSTLKSGSCIRANAVSGGECVAFDLIEVRRAGSQQESATTLRSGYNFYQLDRKKTIEKNIRDVEQKIDYINSMLGPAGAELGKSLTMTDSKQKKIYAFLSEKNHLETTRAGFIRELERINMFPLKKTDSKIIVDEILHKGVLLEFNDMKETVFQDIRGPVTIDKKLIQL